MDYQRYFEIAIAIFNENVGSDFTVDNVVLDYLTSDNQKQVFERFCTEYFPYRLKDRYEEEGYFDFYATAFVSKEPGGKDGILLHTDIPYTPAELIHVLLHELAHIFCLHNELDGASFYDTYCEGYADTSFEDSQINAGYADVEPQRQIDIHIHAAGQPDPGLEDLDAHAGNVRRGCGGQFRRTYRAEDFPLRDCRGQRKSESGNGPVQEDTTNYRFHGRERDGSHETGRAGKLRTYQGRGRPHRRRGTGTCPYPQR